MTAMTAEQDDDGPPGLFYGLADQEQLDVLRALGAQCRAAIRGAGLETDPRWLDEIKKVYRHAGETADAIINGHPWAMPELPACAGCRLATAALLCSVAVSAGRRSGLSEELIAHHCRETAAL